MSQATDSLNRAVFGTKLTVVLLLLSIPLVVNAGAFSFLKNLFERSEARTVATTNSQKMNLLKAVLNADPHSGTGGGDITVVGGTSLLAENGPSGSSADAEVLPGKDQISVYVVREGDSLSQIATMFGVSTNTILWANDIKRGDLIQEGQTLVILPVSGVRHTVKSGETVKSITEKYKGDYDEVLAYNGLTRESYIQAGDEVVIPNGEIAAPKPVVRASVRTATLRNASGPSYSGYYMRPLDGYRTQGLHGYNGVDIAAPTGTGIVASAAGTVIISKNSGWNGGYGKYVVINHENGTQTLYAHNNENIVSVGQQVVQGQVVGYVGSTGKSTGPHLHFEVRGAKNPF